jgi:hypothetical protein
VHTFECHESLVAAGRMKQKMDRVINTIWYMSMKNDETVVVASGREATLQFDDPSSIWACTYVLIGKKIKNTVE